MTRLTRRRVAGNDHWRVWPDRPGSLGLHSGAHRRPPSGENNVSMAMPFFAYFAWAGSGFAWARSGPLAGLVQPRPRRAGEKHHSVAMPFFAYFGCSTSAGLGSVGPVRRSRVSGGPPGRLAVPARPAVPWPVRRSPGAVWRSRVSGDADNGISKQDIESRRERERATSRQPLASVRSSSL